MSRNLQNLCLAPRDIEIGHLYYAHRLLFLQLQGSKFDYNEYGFGSVGQGGLQLRKLNQPFSWNSDGNTAEDGLEGEGEAKVSNVTKPAINTCRNSVQGRSLIADDKG